MSKIDKAVSNHLGLESTNDNSESKVSVCPYDGIWDAVSEAAKNGARIWVGNTVCTWVNSIYIRVESQQHGKQHGKQYCQIYRHSFSVNFTCLSTVIKVKLF